MTSACNGLANGQICDLSCCLHGAVTGLVKSVYICVDIYAYAYYAYAYAYVCVPAYAFVYVYVYAYVFVVVYVYVYAFAYVQVNVYVYVYVYAYVHACVYRVVRIPWCWLCGPARNNGTWRHIQGFTWVLLC